MKILLLITGLGIGGAERQAIDLADCFTANGHQVLLAYMHGPILLRTTDARVQLVDLQMTKTPSGLLKAGRHFIKLMQAFQPDVVHSHLVHANLFARIIRLFIAIPVLISSAHSINQQGWWRMLAYAVTDKLSDLTTNVCEEGVAMFKRWRAVSNNRVRVVYNGISTTKFHFDSAKRLQLRQALGIDESTRLLLAVGRFYPAKDYPNMLQAMVKLRARFPNFILAIAGDGPLLADMKQLTTQLDLQKQLIFLGIRDDVDALLSAADIFVLSSAWEGAPLVVLEAMACQRLVVSTNCGGIAETIGPHGILAPVNDADKLADALALALALPPDKTAQIGLALRRRIEQQFSITAVAEQWQEIYQQLISNNRNTDIPNKFN